MTSNAFPTSRYWILDRSRTRVFFSRRELTLLALLLLQIFMLVGSRIDGAWIIPKGIGFSQHYGFFTIFVITPVILLLSGFILEKFVETLEQVDAYCTTSDAKTRQWVVRLASNYADRLALRGNSTGFLVGLIVFFFLWCVWNVTQTINPLPTYKHDVFDAWPHRYGFIAAKLYVLVAISIVWAVAVFIALHVTYSMVSLLRFLSRHDALRVNLFHRDNCGGTSCFGDINLAITALYVCLLSVLVAMKLTHGVTYLVMNAGFCGCILLTFVQSFGAVFSIHRVLKKNKIQCLDEIAVAINKRVGQSHGAISPFPSDLLTFRTHVLGLHTFPYARGAIAAVNILRFVPVFAAVVTVARGYVS